jgi:hypothetical protein
MVYMEQLKYNKVKIDITSRNVTHFKNKGYSVKNGDMDVLVDIKDLSDNSRIKVIAICGCGSENEISYCKYLENKKRQGFYGCKKCSNKKRTQTNLNKFGVDNFMKTDECKEKISSNNIKKYGVKTTLLEKNTKEKIKNTLKEKYGVCEILSSNEIRNKIIKTNIKKYGVPHYSKTIDFYNKTYKRWEKEIINKLQKYNIVDFYLKDDRTIDIKCDCGCEHYFNINSKNLYQRKEIQNNILCTICNPVINQKQSGKELQILNFIKENYNDSVIENDKNVISELDIYLPELKIALEFNGIYWHSDIYKEKNYHLNKTEECEKNGIQLIHIYEDDWNYKQDIVKSMILNKLNKIENKIYARKTEIKEIDDNKLVRKFLNENHIQGFVGSSVKLGLFYENELVSLMTFGKRRIAMGKKKSNDDEYELLRFCNKLNTSVIGGASKLFKYFINNYKPKEIITYADRSYSNGNLYKQLGFEFIGKTEPNYSYYDLKCNKYNRFSFRKDVLIKNGYDKNKTEFDIMNNLGYLRVYNSGNLKFYFKLN